MCGPDGRCRTTHVRSPTAQAPHAARSTPDRTVPLTDKRQMGPYSSVSFEMLPIQLPIVPVNLLSRSRLRSTSKRLRNAGRRGQSPQGRIRRMREKRNSQIHEVGEPAELRRKRSFQIIAGKRPITADVGSHRCVGAAGRSRSAPAIAEHNPRPDHPSSVRWLRCVGGSASAVRSGLGGADRVCQRMILRARRAPVPLPSTPHCVRHVGVVPRCAGSSRARSPTSRALPAYAAAHRVVLPQYPRSTAADGTAAVPRVATAVSHGCSLRSTPSPLLPLPPPRRASAPSTAPPTLAAPRRHARQCCA